VTVHVRRLREKVEDDPVAPRRILTVWGVGYRYEAEEAR
jgi:DNA-binding response OmpR family regulator